MIYYIGLVTGKEMSLRERRDMDKSSYCIFHLPQSNIQLPVESDFAQRLFAMESGDVTVSLWVTSFPHSSNQVVGSVTLRDEIQVQVCEKDIFNFVKHENQPHTMKFCFFNICFF